MLEGAQLFAVVSAALLLAAFLVWATLLKGPMLQRLDGSRASNARPAEIATWILASALGLSAIAAVVAIVGRIVT
jgi:hypothetical protein